MNERIRELALQAEVKWLHQEDVIYSTMTLEQFEKFAELIVGECVKVAMKAVSDDEPKEAWYLIKEHFGVEE
jgi:hypothetical protein